mmetsp:Transcript_15757/g.49339  ORF Transcript_15757/g.49339 Transcript_15757/m.49339 type:complete len:803 (-) Transcript_15757:65-2473(-)
MGKKNNRKPKTETEEAAPAEAAEAAEEVVESGSGEEEASPVESPKSKKGGKKGKKEVKEADEDKASEEEGAADAGADDDAAAAAEADADDEAKEEAETTAALDGTINVYDFCGRPHTRDFVNLDADRFTKYDKKDGPFYSTEPDAEAHVKVAKKGMASIPPTTICGDFKIAATGAFKDRVALEAESMKDGSLKTWTWAEYYDTCVQTAKALIALGVKRHQSVNIIGFNAPEWIFANMGAILAGAKAAGIYTTNGTEACKYIADHSDARVVVVENQAQLAKWQPVRKELKKVAAYVVYNDEVPADANKDKKLPPVLSWAEFLEKGKDVETAEVEKRIAAQVPGNCCTLIYTSGTTGTPKAVMISHDNASWTSKALLTHVDFPVKEDQHIVSYLPLSHIAAQVLDIMAPIQVVNCLGGNATVHFARPDALKGSLKDTLVRVRPTIFFGVPRVWEKFAAAIKAIGASKPGILQKVSGWAKGKMLATIEAREAGSTDKSVPWGSTISGVLLGAIPKALGLDRCFLRFTGAAPISAETLKYFASIGMPVMELYGMSENTGPQTVSILLPGKGGFKMGSCGPSMDGAELKIDHQADRGDKEGEGEICMRGRHVMMGYMKNEEKSREAIDEEGWLHSGDVGRIDEFGFLRITGRIKELIITAGGENVAPVPMEDMVKDKCPAIKNVVMVGDKKPYCVCLITLHLEGNENEGFSNKLTGPSASISTATTPEEARDDIKWTEYIQSGLDHANAQAEKNASKIQKFRILTTDFSVEAGHLTSTLKLKRSVVHAEFADDIEFMYADKGKGKKK